MKTKCFFMAVSLAVLSLGLASGKNNAQANAATAVADGEGITVRAHLDRPLLVRGEGEQEVTIKIEVTGGKAPERVADRAPLNLAVVLDRSGSMTGAKLEKARQAAMMLIDQLEADDVVSLVIYDTDVQVLAPARSVGNRQKELKRLIAGVKPGGSTALHAGVKTGGEELAEFFDEQSINRVILLSDGIANVGPKSNREIADLGRRLAERGMSVTTIGLGDDYNEDLMTALAESSDANYYFVDDVETLVDVFERELGELKEVVARKIVVEVELPDGVRPQRFLGRETTFEAGVGRVQFGILAGEQQRDLLLRCLVDESLVAGAEQQLPLAEVNVSFEDPLAGASDRRTVDYQVVAGVTGDVAEAEAQVDKGIEAEAEVYATADVSRDALKLADAGDYEAAQTAIHAQLEQLRCVQKEAPADQQAALEREIQVLEGSCAELQAGDGLTKDGRKRLQWGIYNRANSKSLDAPVSGQ